MKHKLTRNRLRQAYQSVFQSDDGQIVLADLLRFTNHSGDPFNLFSTRKTDNNLGRRRVTARILHYLNMTEDEALRLAKEEKSHG